MQLRDYQLKCIKDTYAFFRQGIRSVLLYAPTGSGKTHTASKMTADSVRKGRRVLFLVHRAKLIDQTKATLVKHYGFNADDIGIIWADSPTDYTRPVQIAMVQTVQNRELPPNIGLVIIDEAHTTSYYKIVSRLQTHYSGGILPLSPCYFVGLSATPWRTKKKEGYCQFYQAVVKAPHPDELIKRGHLVHARHFGWGGLIDYSQLETGSDGDFTQSSMQKVCNSDFNKIVVDKFLEVSKDRKSIAFCAGVAQARDLAAQFNEAGIVSECVTGDTPEDTRELIYSRFKTGQTQIITSVAVLCEGFDETSCDAAIIARPTKSRALLIQMCGRALRLHAGKSDAMLLDFADNFKRLGTATKKYPIPLCPRDKDFEFIETKECPQCHANIPKFAKICPECGYEFEGGEEELGDSDDDLIFGEILTEEQKKQLGYLRGQLQRAYKAGRDIGRVTWLFVRKFEFLPPQHWYKDAVFRRGLNVHPDQRKTDEQAFLKHLRSTRQNAPTGWLGEQFRREFGSGFYNFEPIAWWEVLEVPKFCNNWEVIKTGYSQKITNADESEAALLNFCLEEAKEFCSILRLKAV